MKTHNIGSSTGSFKCNICDEIFTSSFLLALHKLKHCKIIAGNICTVCQAVLVDDEAFYRHHFEHSSGKGKSKIFVPANCIICRQTLQTEVEMKLHSRSHLGQVKQRCYICRICRRVFESSTGRTVLIKPGENFPTAICDQCTPLVPNGTGCLSSNSNGASNGSQFKCHLCEQVFPSPTQLQVHLIEHTFYGMNQFTCFLCSSVFTSAIGLRRHVVAHEAKDMPYECDLCQKKFFFRAELDNHMLIHSGPSTDKSHVQREVEQQFTVPHVVESYSLASTDDSIVKRDVEIHNAPSNANTLFMDMENHSAAYVEDLLKREANYNKQYNSKRFKKDVMTHNREEKDDERAKREDAVGHDKHYVD